MQKLLTHLSEKYNIDATALTLLLSKMEHITFDNKQTILDNSNTKSTFYILAKGIWRAYKVVDGDENTLWFERYSDVIYSEIAPNYLLESVGESEAYYMDKKDLDELCLNSHAISNLIRILIEKFYFDVTRISVDLSHQLAKERYLSMLENDPELFQLVPQKYIASFLGLTPQSLSRLRRKILDK